MTGRRDAIKMLTLAAAGLAVSGMSAESGKEGVMRKMKVLLVNGSPHENGCTRTALDEIGGALKKDGIDLDVFWIGNNLEGGCLGCGYCRKHGKCFRDDAVNRFLDAAKNYDGFVFGSPVHFASASGNMTGFLDRVFFCGARNFAGKPGAVAVSCRRGGSTAALDQLGKYLIYSSMPQVPSQYWPQVHGNTPDEVRKDLEGLQIMRVLGHNMAWMLKCFELGRQAGLSCPGPEEPHLRTNFIR